MPAKNIVSSSSTIAVQSQGSMIQEITGWKQAQIEVLKTQIAPGCTDAELALFGQVCAQTGLDPFRRQIYAIRRSHWNPETKTKEEKMTIQTGIDGFRAIASSTGRYAGSDEPLFDEGLSLFQHKQTGRGYPSVAKVTVWAIVGGIRCPFTGVAEWEEFAQTTKEGKPTSMWAKMPYNQLAKCAEGQALRKAFPERIGGVALSDAGIDELGGDRTPVDFHGSEMWHEFLDAIVRAEQSEDPTGNLNKLEEWAYRQVKNGKLPLIARNGVEREVEKSRDRIKDRMGRPLPTPQDIDVSVVDSEDS